MIEEKNEAGKMCSRVQKKKMIKNDTKTKKGENKKKIMKKSDRKSVQQYSNVYCYLYGIVSNTLYTSTLSSV